MQSVMNDNEIYDKRYTDNYVCVLKSALSICFVYFDCTNHSFSLLILLLQRKSLFYVFQNNDNHSDRV